MEGLPALVRRPTFSGGGVLPDAVAELFDVQILGTIRLDHELVGGQAIQVLQVLCADGQELLRLRGGGHLLSPLTGGEWGGLNATSGCFQTTPLPDGTPWT